jgi:hypothetical protein
MPIRVLSRHLLPKVLQRLLDGRNYMVRHKANWPRATGAFLIPFLLSGYSKFSLRVPQLEVAAAIINEKASVCGPVDEWILIPGISISRC